MATETRHSGTLRTDYEADRARLDDLRPLTADTDILLRRLTEASREMTYRDADGREGTLTPLLENHVLTVLADIHRKRLTGYGSTFADAQGTAAQVRYARKLEQDVERWAARLEAYLRTAFAKGMTNSTAVQTARELHDRLTGALRTPDGEDNRCYYRMLRTVTAIQENADRYWQQAADSGDTEPALALLVAYLNNYASIADTFNRRFASLPELYRREVLHARPTEAVPDNAYLVITPAAPSGSSLRGRGGFTLAKGTAFATGEDLIYKTTQEEYISPMRCVSVQAVSLPNSSRGGASVQTLHFEDATNAETLFSGGEPLRTGWQLESPILVLEEGKREVVSVLSHAHGKGRASRFYLDHTAERFFNGDFVSHGSSFYELMILRISSSLSVWMSSSLRKQANSSSISIASINKGLSNSSLTPSLSVEILHPSTSRIGYAVPK